MKLPGQINVTRPMSTRGPTQIRIEIIDTASHVHFLEITLSPEDMMLALTGQGATPCEFELRNAETVGMRSEHKTELVPFDPNSISKFERRGLNDSQRSKSVDKALAPFESDGWRGSSSDLFNHYKRKGDNQTVTFFRHVDPKTGKPT